MMVEDNVILFEETSFSYDQPEITDYDYEYVSKYEKGGNIKDIVSLLKTNLIIYNQGARHETRNACGHYSKQHIINAMNIVENEAWGTQYQEDPAPFWIEWQKERMPQSIWSGTSIQQNLKTFLARGLIGGYARCNSIQASKDALDKGHIISTGSRNGDRPQIRNTGIYSTKTSGSIQGHLFCIVGYDDSKQIFYGVNSYGPTRGPKKGRFDIPYSEYDNLYSKNAVFDVDSSEAIRQYKEASSYEREFLKAIQTGITNGERPKENAIREEVAVMVYRIYDKIKKDIEVRINERVEEELQKILKVIGK